MLFAIPMVWREGKDHITDCHFCTMNLKGINRKNKHHVQYPDIPSVIRPIPHGLGLSVPESDGNMEYSSVCLFCYLMAYQPSRIISCQIHPSRRTHSWEDKKVHTFPKGICPRVKVIVWLESELTYYNSAVQRFTHCATRTPSPYIALILNIKTWLTHISQKRTTSQFPWHKQNNLTGELNLSKESAQLQGSLLKEKQLLALWDTHFF